MRGMGVPGHQKIAMAMDTSPLVTHTNRCAIITVDRAWRRIADALRLAESETT
jgi:hypothetical protein